MAYAIIAVTLIFLSDVHPIIKQKDKAQIVKHSVFFLICATVCVLYAADVKLPSPVAMADRFMRFIGLCYRP